MVAAPQRQHALRELFNGLRWLARTGSEWRMLPHDLPPWHAVYQQTRRWLKARCFETMAEDLRVLLRVLAGRNDAPSAVTRLTDMGVEPFLLSSSLLGVLAQRLVRKLCPHCKRADERGRWHPVGCEHCLNTGYKGRTGVYELMVADEKVRALIHNRAAESQLFVAAEAAGLRSMREDGQRLIDEGITSPEEVMSVTRD